MIAVGSGGAAHGRDDRYPVERISAEFRRRFPGMRRAEIPPDCVRRFRAVIRAYYRRYARDFPWRRTDDPYHILVSEIMLQQTQTARVAERFPDFIASFPTVRSLADAAQREVLAAWQGLGYNRRAAYLHRMAREIVARHGGRVPDAEEELRALPGIGAATAASIAAFAFDRPTVFIETNIRAVFIHFFFHGRSGVRDGQIAPLVARTLPRRGAHVWYSALMDYGAMLKRRYPNPARASAHHVRQARFEGSRRQLRGAILRIVLERPGASVAHVARMTGRTRDEIRDVAGELAAEGLINMKRGMLYG